MAPAPEFWRRGERAAPALTLGVLSLVAGGAVAAVRALLPFAHGWWLVAFLVLVGGAAQLLLGLGGAALIRPVAGSPAARGLHRALVLWNAGVVLVPLGVFADAPLRVGVGGVAQLIALCLFAVGVLAPPQGARGAVQPRGRVSYLVLVGALAASVLIGMRLGGALPE